MGFTRHIQAHSHREPDPESTQSHTRHALHRHDTHAPPHTAHSHRLRHTPNEPHRLSAAAQARGSRTMLDGLAQQPSGRVCPKNAERNGGGLGRVFEKKRRLSFAIM